jgi:hypothetical protein
MRFLSFSGQVRARRSEDEGDGRLANGARLRTKGGIGKIWLRAATCFWSHLEDRILLT